MKIGYFCNITNWKKKPYTEILDNARDIALYCDKNNWESIWFTEQNQTQSAQQADYISGIAKQMIKQTSLICLSDSTNKSIINLSGDTVSVSKQ